VPFGSFVVVNMRDIICYLYLLCVISIQFTILRPKEDAPSRKKPLPSSYDPFASSHLEQALVVAAPSALPRGAEATHTLVLNKYATFEDHVSG
jgi:hypothetical protein